MRGNGLESMELQSTHVSLSVGTFEEEEEATLALSLVVTSLKSVTRYAVTFPYLLQ